MDVTNTDAGRPASGRAGVQAAIRAALLIAALLALRFGVTWEQEWQLVSKRNFDYSVGGWARWLLPVVLGGFLFSLAARPPRSFRYRPWVPLLLGIVPFLMIAHFVTIFTVDWQRLPWPELFMAPRFYMTFEVQFALALMLGVALASGFRDDEDTPRRSIHQGPTPDLDRPS